MTPEELKTQSTHIVTGKVNAIYSRDVESKLYGEGTLETHYLLEIEVSGVEKGDGLGKGEFVYVRCWRLKKHGASGLVPGPSGHFGIPKEGEQIRAYLDRGKKDPKKDSADRPNRGIRCRFPQRNRDVENQVE